MGIIRIKGPLICSLPLLVCGEGRSADMSCHKSTHTLAFTLSPRKLVLLFGNFACIVLFLSLINPSSCGILRRSYNVVERDFSPKIKRHMFYPNMILSDSHHYQPSKRFNEEKRDPLFEDMSTEELYRMLQLIDMAGGTGPVVASSQEMNNLNSLLQNADKSFA